MTSPRTAVVVPEQSTRTGRESRTGGSGRTRSRLTAVLQSPRTRLGLLLLLLGGAGLGVWLVGAPSQGEIRRLVGGAGALGPVVYVLVYIVLTVLLVPGAVVTIVGGALFGSLFGTIYTVVGASLGAVAAFALGRWLGREQVANLAGKRIGRLEGWLADRGFVAILYLRLIPVVPFNVLNYAAGVTNVTRRDYVVATAVGIIPGTFAYATLGGSLTECVGSSGCDLTSPAFLTAVGLIVVLVAGGPFVNRWMRRRGKGPPKMDTESESPANDVLRIKGMQ